MIVFQLSYQINTVNISRKIVPPTLSIIVYIYSQMQEKVLVFRSITQDEDIEEKQIIKFINWSKGDVEQALNYYFKHLEKGKIKKKPNQNQSLLKSKPSQSISGKKQQQTVIIREETKQVRPSEVSISSEEQSFGNSKDAFSVLRKGSIQHKKTHDFIKHVREVYKLPIKGKPQKQLLNRSKSSLPQNEGKIPEQFLMVDCLSQAFNNQKIESLLNRNKDQLQKSHEQIPMKNNENKICIQVSVSEDLKQNESEAQKINEQSSFKDLEDYDYKLVYSQSQPRKNPPANEYKISDGQSQNQNSKIVKEKKKSKKETKKSKQEKKVSLNNSKVSKTIKQQQLQLPIIKSMSKKEQQYSEDKQKCISQKEIYVGQYFIKGFCTQKRRFEPNCIGTQVKIVSFIEPIKAKKKNFGKKTQRNMNMRVFWQQRQIGRINDEQVRVILPLMNENLINMQFYLQDAPLMADMFKPITLKAKVYIQNQLITEPIIQNYQPQQNDKDRVHQLSGLLSKLNLPIITQPLIRGKSKYIKNQKPKDKKKQSLDLMVFGLSEQDKLIQIQEKNKLEINRIRSDFNYKAKQQSLKDMIKKNQQNLKDKIQIEQHQINHEEGQVKKKIIEIDSQSQKNKFSELIDLHEQNCEPFYPENNFISDLYQYQAMALSWMLKREGFLFKQQAEQLHPLWTEYSIPTCDKYKFYFNELTGQLCVKKPTTIIKCQGGILADEMGLGKTVMMTALIVSNPSLSKSQDQGSTLVVVPLTLLSQWQSQISKHTKNQKVIVYYSSERKKIINSLGKYDVVLSTYGTISHEFAQGYHNKKMGIYKYKWHRIILDEAHYIKGRVIQTSKAVYELNGTYRWCLTGTPIQNTVTDIFSLIHFIKYTPWSEFACWNRFIEKPLEEEDESVYQVLRIILKQVFLRRTKSSHDAKGKPIIQLPARVSKVQLLTMSEKQRQFYDSIYTSSRSNFDELIQKGILEAKYMQVLEMLMRLRQICCHPILFKSVTKFSKNVDEFEIELKKFIQKSQKRRKAQSQSQDQYYEPLIDADNQEHRIKTNGNEGINEEYLKEILQKITNQALDCCIICLQQPQDPVITSCMHIFCKSCNIRQIQEKGSCAFCRRILTRDDFIYLPRQNRLNISKEKKEQKMFRSTKMIALSEHLEKLQDDDKVVVFSQFLGMLDLLQGELKQNGLKFVRMEGSNTHKQRTKIVKAFQQDPSVRIFLVSLKTAGVGLNLVAANKVFLMDPWWNPAVQEQAIERVHRIGQKRQVEIVRFIMDKTIQTRMLELNTQKKALSQNVLNQNQDKDGNSRQKIDKLKYLMENY